MPLMFVHGPGVFVCPNILFLKGHWSDWLRAHSDGKRESGTVSGMVFVINVHLWWKVEVW